MIKILHKTSHWLGLLMVAICTCVPTVGAYTVDEIIANGEWMKVTYRYANYFDSRFYDLAWGPTITEVVQLEKVDDQHILFKGIRGSLDFMFDLVDYSGKLSTDGVCLSIPGTRTSTATTSADNHGNWSIIPTLETSTPQHYSDKHWELRIYRNTDGTLYFQEDYANDDSWGAVLAYGGMTIPSTHGVIIDWARFEPYTGYNAVATDSYTNWLGGKNNAYVAQTIERQYPVTVNLDFDSNTFSIINFSKLGYGDSAQDGTYTAIDGMTTYCREYEITGTIVPEEQKLLFDMNQETRWKIQCATIIDYDWFWPITRNTYDWWGYCLTSKDFVSTKQHSQLVAHYYEPEDNKPEHNEKSVIHHWVTNHGKRRTFDGFTIEVDPYTYGLSDGDVISYYPDEPMFYDTFDNTVITGRDCTLDVDLTLNQVGWDAEGQNGYVNATIKTNKNDMYVDHYDIMVIGGYHDYIDEAGFQIDNEEYGLGVKNAKVLVDGETDNRFGTVTKPAVTRAANNTIGSHDYSIDHWVMKDFIADHFNDKGEYTFFIRANYKPETGLAPTFHALKHASGAPTPTGIADMTADDNAPAVYYNLNGIEVAEDDLTPGIYICRRGATAKKVVIR